MLFAMVLGIDELDRPYSLFQANEVLKKWGAGAQPLRGSEAHPLYLTRVKNAVRCAMRFSLLQPASALVHWASYYGFAVNA
jgi:hypothetical protein